MAQRKWYYRSRGTCPRHPDVGTSGQTAEEDFDAGSLQDGHTVDLSCPGENTGFSCLQGLEPSGALLSLN